LHTLLTRQLARLGFKEDAVPSELEAWQKLIEFVSTAYTEADQERYMLERSMELSSRELMGLNEKLENAQHIARLGYWSYNNESDKFSFSKELCLLLGLNPTKPTLNFEEYFNLIHEKNQAYFRKWKEEIPLGEKLEYEGEARIKNAETNEYGWYYIKAHMEQLGKVLSGIAINITKRKAIEKEVASLNQQLVESARMAGMADVAISVLHNVGNILNSANVSLGLLQEKIERNHTQKLFKVIDMIGDNISSLATYLTEDPKGKLIPEYLTTLEKVIKEEHHSFANEIENLVKHIQHIKDIVVMQQTVSKVSGMAEKVFVPEIFDTALQINGETSLANDIKLTQEYKESCFISVDKSKLLQILVNLIQNAKDAVCMNPANVNKKINLSIKKDATGKDVYISVEDNGVGIDPDHLAKIFSFGFTTKKNGHGFGLHASALAVKEIGGSLKVESQGVGKGAVFTIALPINNN
jgi:C4-dicarboxylate-specific signal transduction histidine kinase